MILSGHLWLWLASAGGKLCNLIWGLAGSLAYKWLCSYCVEQSNSVGQGLRDGLTVCQPPTVCALPPPQMQNLTALRSLAMHDCSWEAASYDELLLPLFTGLERLALVKCREVGGQQCAAVQGRGAVGVARQACLH